MGSKFFDYGDLCLQQNVEEEQRKELFVELELGKGGEDQVLWNLQISKFSHMGFMGYKKRSFR